MSRPGVACVLLIVASLLSWTGCASAEDAARLTELQRSRSGQLDIVVLSARDSWRQGDDTFVLEFRSVSNQQLVDVGTVRTSASMPMPGMAPMFATVNVRPTSVAGRYEVTSDFSMAGTWRVMVEWDGPAGQGSAAFSGSVQ